MSNENITDDELIDLINEQLDPTRAQQVHERISADEQLAERFDALAFVHGSALTDLLERGIEQAPTARLRETLEDTVKEAERTTGHTAAPDRLHPAGTSWRSWFGVAAMSAFAASVVTGGLVFGLMQNSAESLDWQDSVAVYQRLYSTETLTGATPDLVDASQAAARLTRVSGIPFQVPDLSIEKLTFKRGQILEFKQRPLVQLAYLSDKGLPVAICLFKTGLRDHDIQTTQRQGLNSAVWTRNGISTMAIGDLTDEELLRISQLSGG